MCFTEDNPNFYIKSDGTFIHPNVEDEHNNWGNRGGLLDSYENLMDFIKKHGLAGQSFGFGSGPFGEYPFGGDQV
jgi:hypothetical protein